MKRNDTVLAGGRHPQGHPQEPGTTAATAGSATDAVLAIPTSKVKDWHLQRKAVVYIRQSTPQQVVEHRESADRQYSLVHRAALLGWPKDRVEVV
jgi:hypothetical protein